MHNQPESKNVSPNHTSHTKIGKKIIYVHQPSPLHSFKRKRPLPFSLGKTFESERQQQKY